MIWEWFDSHVCIMIQMPQVPKSFSFDRLSGIDIHTALTLLRHSCKQFGLEIWKGFQLIGRRCWTLELHLSVTRIHPLSHACSSASHYSLVGLFQKKQSCYMFVVQKTPHLNPNWLIWFNSSENSHEASYAHHSRLVHLTGCQITTGS